MPSLASITSVSPSSGPTSGGTPLTVTGSGLGGASAVAFGATQAAPEPGGSDTSLTVVTPNLPAGTVNVQVNVPTGLSPVTPKATFQFIPPSIDKIHPTSGPITGNMKVTIVGTYLGGALTVQFGKVAAANAPTIKSDSEITVIAPAGLETGPVAVQINLPTGLIPSDATAAPQFTYTPPGPPPPPINAQFVVVNKTGVPDALVFVKFLGAPITADNIEQTFAGWKPLDAGASTAARSYSLQEMTSPMTLAGSDTTAPNFGLNNYAGGRIYFSLAQPLASTTIPAAQNPADPDFSTVYGFVEPSVFPNFAAGSTNIDASYVDFVGLPISIAIKNISDGSFARPPVNNPLVSPGGATLFKALTGDTNIPAQAQVAANSSGIADPDYNISIAGTSRILSPSLYQASLIGPSADSYHGWISSSDLIGTLQANKSVLKIASYVTSDAKTSVPIGTLFGFAGSTAKSPISSDWVLSQHYSLEAQAVSDLNPKGKNPRLTGLQGLAGIVMTGSGTSVGTFSIYLTNADLDAPTGVYGANPPYVVDWMNAPGGATAYSIPSVVNDLSGRVVGDLLAGFNFGWAASSIVIAAQAAATNTQTNLANSVFDVESGALANSPIGALSTGQFFYLLSLQPSTGDIAQWFGQSIQPNNPTFYNNYASDFQKLTNCYNMAFTDRLQGSSDPDMFFPPSPATYVEITLLPGAYTVTNNNPKA